METYTITILNYQNRVIAELELVLRPDTYVTNIPSIIANETEDGRNIIV